jgi:predicted transposase/invertase (TIGR01784 family)
MRRDSIFYKLFQQSPTLLFELLDSTPNNAAGYRFESVAVKEPKFEIDGVFLPPETDPPGVLFLAEVQFQCDQNLYERMFAELFPYFSQNRERFSDWQVVAIYPSRNIEQTTTFPYRALLNSDQVHRIYLNELGDIAQLSLGVALMVLTTLTERQAPKAARLLLNRAQAEIPAPESRAIIEMITTIMVYRFTNLSREEIEQMLGTTIQETRVYQEAKAEGAIQEALFLILQQLTYRFREIPDTIQTQLRDLSLVQLEALGKSLLDFQNLADLEAWLQAQM